MLQFGGDASGLCVSNQGFACATDVPFAYSSTADGELGLAFPAASLDNLTTVFQTLMQNKTMCPQGVFAFWLGRYVHTMCKVV